MTEIPEDVMKAAAETVMSVGLETVGTGHVLAVARAILAERERCAQVAERDADWSAFGKRGIEQWDGGPDAVRDYRIGIASGRAIAASIRGGAQGEGANQCLTDSKPSSTPR